MKDVPILLRAFAIINLEFPETQLMVVGGPDVNAKSNDSYYLEIEELIKDLGISDSVCLTGPQGDVARYLRASDLYVNNSLYEGMSNTILEAMSCRVPVVATRVGGTPFIVQDGHNGLLVSAGSAPELANAIKKTINNPAMTTTMAQNGLSYVETNHRLEVFVRMHDDLYREEYQRIKGNVFSMEEQLPLPTVRDL